MKLAAALQLLLPGMPMIYYGDEFGMDGAQDPDCRRGMLWDPARQDTDLFEWYRKLLHIRKRYSELFDWNTMEYADDATAILKRTDAQGEITVLFHCANGSISIPEYRGKIDLLTGNIFEGKLRSWQTVVLVS